MASHLEDGVARIISGRKHDIIRPSRDYRGGVAGRLLLFKQKPIALTT